MFILPILLFLVLCAPYLTIADLIVCFPCTCWVYGTSIVATNVAKCNTGFSTVYRIICMVSGAESSISQTMSARNSCSKIRGLWFFYNSACNLIVQQSNILLDSVLKPNVSEIPTCTRPHSMSYSRQQGSWQYSKKGRPWEAVDDELQSIVLILAWSKS